MNHSAARFHATPAPTSWPHQPKVGPRQHANWGGTVVHCPGHDGPHRIGLNMWLGGDPLKRRMTVFIRQAMHHVVSASDWELDTGAPGEATAEQFTAWAAVVDALLDRAETDTSDPAGMVEVDDTVWEALIRCLADASEYMNANNYADDTDFEDDAAAAAALTTVHGGPGLAAMDICWR